MRVTQLEPALAPPIRSATILRRPRRTEVRLLHDPLELGDPRLATLTDVGLGAKVTIGPSPGTCAKCLRLPSRQMMGGPRCFFGRATAQPPQ